MINQKLILIISISSTNSLIYFKVFKSKGVFKTRGTEYLQIKLINAFKILVGEPNGQIKISED